MFRVKRVNLHLRNDVRMADINIIYEKSTVQLASVGLAQARPNYYAMVGWLVGYFRDQDKKGVSVGKNVH